MVWGVSIGQIILWGIIGLIALSTFLSSIHYLIALKDAFEEDADHFKHFTSCGAYFAIAGILYLLLFEHVVEYWM